MTLDVLSEISAKVDGVTDSNEICRIVDELEMLMERGDPDAQDQLDEVQGG